MNPNLKGYEVELDSLHGSKIPSKVDREKVDRPPVMLKAPRITR